MSELQINNVLTDNYIVLCGGTGGVGKTATQMQMIATFEDAGWNFVDTWSIYEGRTYPRLKWQQGGTYSGGSGMQVETVSKQVFTLEDVSKGLAYFPVKERSVTKTGGSMGGDWGYENTGYGLTWWVSNRDGEKYFAHSGSVSGYTAFVMGNRTRGFGIALLTNGNRAHPHLVKICNLAMDLLPFYMVGSCIWPLFHYFPGQAHGKNFRQKAGQGQCV